MMVFVYSMSSEREPRGLDDYLNDIEGFQNIVPDSLKPIFKYESLRTYCKIADPLNETSKHIRLFKSEHLLAIVCGFILLKFRKIIATTNDIFKNNAWFQQLNKSAEELLQKLELPPQIMSLIDKDEILVHEDFDTELVKVMTSLSASSVLTALTTLSTGPNATEMLDVGVADKMHDFLQFIPEKRKKQISPETYNKLVESQMQRLQRMKIATKNCTKWFMCFSEAFNSNGIRQMVVDHDRTLFLTEKCRSIPFLWDQAAWQTEEQMKSHEKGLDTNNESDEDNDDNDEDDDTDIYPTSCAVAFQCILDYDLIDESQDLEDSIWSQLNHILLFIDAFDVISKNDINTLLNEIADAVERFHSGTSEALETELDHIKHILHEKFLTNENRKKFIILMRRLWLEDQSWVTNLFKTISRVETVQMLLSMKNLSPEIVIESIQKIMDQLLPKMIAGYET